MAVVEVVVVVVVVGAAAAAGAGAVGAGAGAGAGAVAVAVAVVRRQEAGGVDLESDEATRAAREERHKKPKARTKQEQHHAIRHAGRLAG